MLKVLNEQKNILKSCLNTLNSYKKDSFSEITFSDVLYIKKPNLIQIWKVETGLYDELDCIWIKEDIRLYIGFRNDFPFSVPYIFIDKEDLEVIGNIPHVSIVNYDVCIFDSFVIVDSKRPVDVILQALDKAKKTIIEGMKKSNLQDFDNEIKAYWAAPNEDREISNIYYQLVEQLPEDNNLFVLIYTKKRVSINIIFNGKESLIKAYENYLSELGIKYEIKSIFYIGLVDKNCSPPYRYNNKESLEIIGGSLNKEFKTFYNKKNSTKTVIFHKFIDGNFILLGWRYSSIKRNFNGFRTEKLSEFDLTFNQHLPNHKNSILNFVTEDIKESRILNRSNSIEVVFPKYKFLIAGLGSVGSNLVLHLNNLNFPEFHLVDNDYIEPENIGRYLLGYDSLYKYKVYEIKKFIKNKLPSQKVEAYNESFINLYFKIPDIFNSQDYIFLCTGNINLEKILINELQNKALVRPIFILWVEPFLLGGHCLYIHPSNPVNLNDLYVDLFKYKFSVINHSEFEDKRDFFIIKEGGCQSTYSPYSSAHLSIFLATIYKEIFKIIEGNDNESKAFTWYGDIHVASKLGIKVDPNFKNYELIVNPV